MNETQSARPIGLFDSGIGGLTVLKETMRLLPRESTIYLGDTARVPYGNKSDAAIRRFAWEAAEFFLEAQIKFLVLACNTVSAMALDMLRERLQIPVIGVIEPGSLAAASRTRNGNVGVIGTTATIESGAYQKTIASLRPELSVTAKACPLFVPLVEEGWTRHQVTEEVARIYLASMKAAGVDTVVLGCTHYPLLMDVLALVLGPGVVLINSAAEVAKTVRDALERLDLLNPKQGQPPERRVCVTDDPEKFSRVAINFLGQALGPVELVRIP